MIDNPTEFAKAVVSEYQTAKTPAQVETKNQIAVKPSPLHRSPRKKQTAQIYLKKGQV
uniref:Uncharacterized protein n=1 Tax=Rhizophora mucronata TaxID=61149 RepID=A0A2P2QA07_RHIMU